MSAGLFLALLSVKGIGPKKANALVRAIPLDDRKNLESIIESALYPKLAPQAWKSLCKRGEEIIEESLAYGLSVIDGFSPDYPKNLSRLDSSPLVIFVRGSLSALTTPRPLAIVGSRDPCAYTRENGAIVSGVAAGKATSVISGLAIGCDTIAHREALTKDVLTVGVVAHGLDIIYPKANEGLADEIIASGGCLISEYPVGTPPRPNQFIERDLIQAGLSQSGLLLQSSSRGGSMHAMRALQKLNARIGVLALPPNSGTSDEWGGTIELMKAGEVIVLDAAAESLDSDAEHLVSEQASKGPVECFTQAQLF